jgi:hypothetical protein
MADEESAGRDPVAETRKADIYLASVAEEQIRSFEGLMSASDCNTFARNMSALLDRAKAEKKVKKGDVVVKANVRPGTTTACCRKRRANGTPRRDFTDIHSTT